MTDILIKWFDVTDSTNTQISLAKKELNDMSTYAALFQTAGRGQRGNKWESKSGENLTFSILFKPENIALHDQFIISEAAALGMVDYLRTKGVEALIKWPNDIYVGDKKICGILIENTAENDKLTESIVGIGINLNQKTFDSDAPNPISLSLITGEQYNVKEELPQVLSAIFSHYINITRDEKYWYKRTSLDGRYLETLYRRGEWHEFEETPEGKKIRARILGIDNSACLQLEHEDGTIKTYAFKEIKYIL